MWTFTSDSCGYMLFKDGIPVEGARTLGTRTHTSDGRRRHWRNVRKDIEEYREQAARICREKNARWGPNHDVQPIVQLAGSTPLL